MIATFQCCDSVDATPDLSIEEGASWRAELEIKLQRGARDWYGVPIQVQGAPVLLHGSYVHAYGRPRHVLEVENSDGE